MEHQFTVSVSTERVSGPFASRDDIETELIEAIEGADPSSIQPGDNEYEVTDWAVEAVEVKPRKKATSGDIAEAWRAASRALWALRESIGEDAEVLTPQIKTAQDRFDGLFLRLTEAGLIPDVKR